MKLQLNEEWRISTDRYNFILQQRQIIKEGENAGEERWNADSYHASLEQAVLWFVKLGLTMSDAEGIQSVIDLMKTIQTGVQQALNGRLGEVFKIAHHMEKESNPEIRDYAREILEATGDASTATKA